MPRPSKDKICVILQRMLEKSQERRTNLLAHIVTALEEYDDVTTPADTAAPGWDLGMKLSKTAQYRRAVGSRLFNRDPSVKVTPEDWATESDKLRAPLEEDYLNLCIERTGFFNEAADALDEGFIAYGILWHGFHEEDTRLASVKMLPWREVLFDPDCKNHRDQQFCIRLRKVPKWKLIQRYPKHKRRIMEIPGRHSLTDDDIPESEPTHDATTEHLDIAECYMKVGLHNYRDGANKEKMVDEPRKYTFVPGNSLLLEEGEWEVPYFHINEWPYTVLAFYPKKNSPYFTPPLEPGIPLVRAINKAYSRMVTQYEFGARKIIAIASQMHVHLDQDDLNKIREGRNAIEVIQPKIKTAATGVRVDVGNLIKEIDLTIKEVGETLAYIDSLEQQYEALTGFTKFLQTGQTERQDRSAAASHARTRQTMAQLRYMGTKFDKAMSKALRKMLFSARMTVGPEEIAELMGTMAGVIWGINSLPEDHVDPSGYWINYYIENGKLPIDAARQAVVSLTAPLEGRSPAMTGVVPPIRLHDLSQLSLNTEYWLSVTHVGIELDSTRDKDPEERAAQLKEANNQLTSVLYQTGAPEAASYIVAALAETLGMPAPQIKRIVEIGSLLQQQVFAPKPPEEASPKKTKEPPR